MPRPRVEVGDLVRACADEFSKTHGSSMTAEQWRVLKAVGACRTHELGGHVRECNKCGHREISYNSCGNRHCPKCQSLAKARWLEDRRAELLPVDYYHVVFTLPHELASLALQNKRAVYGLLFRAASRTLLTIAADRRHLGARIGFLAILHTWGQNLLHHPHLHCVVPGGGIAVDGDSWKGCPRGFFLPVRVLSRLFRRLFLEGLAKAFDDGRLGFHGDLQPLRERNLFDDLVTSCRSADWVVYAKAPFGGPTKVLDYLARYTHRVAISNHRLLRFEGGKVTFELKDYSNGGRKKEMTLDATEFVRRFLLHVLPAGFMRIRYYGFLANRHRSAELDHCRRLLDVANQEKDPAPGDWAALMEALTGEDPLACPRCSGGRMQVVSTLPRSRVPYPPIPNLANRIDSS